MNTITQNRNTLIAAIAVTLLGPAAVGAHAGTVNVPTVTVKYADLNLDTQAGAAALYNRIRYAAVQVCGNADPARLDQVAAARPCVQRAIAASVNTIQKPKLTREYQVRQA